jgi:hypothetical protein
MYCLKSEKIPHFSSNRKLNNSPSSAGEGELLSLRVAGKVVCFSIRLRRMSGS